MREEKKDRIKAYPFLVWKRKMRKKAKVADEKAAWATAFDRNCGGCVVYL